jgi:hypothetical protein
MEDGKLVKDQEHDLKWAATNMYGAGNDTVSVTKTREYQTHTYTYHHDGVSLELGDIY